MNLVDSELYTIVSKIVAVESEEGIDLNFVFFSDRLVIVMSDLDDVVVQCLVKDHVFLSDCEDLSHFVQNHSVKDSLSVRSISS